MKRQMIDRAGLACALLLLAAGTAGAGGYFDPEVWITDLRIEPRDAKTATIRFHVSWPGSWRSDINHDAAWVFFKVRANGTAEWQHVRLAADRVLNPTGYDHDKTPPMPARAAGGSLPFFQGRAWDEKVGGVESQPRIFARRFENTELEFIVPDGEDPADGGAGGFTGVFLRRAKTGEGSVTTHGVTVLWDLTAAGQAPLAKALLNAGHRKSVRKAPGHGAHGVIQYDRFEGTEAEIRAFGIEMAYVAEGPFYVGADGTEVNSFYTYSEGGLSSPPYRVKGPGAIPTGRQPGKLWARKGAQPEDGGEIPASFPNGYEAFYCMIKHITPRRYAEFLSTLTPAQSDARWCAESRAQRSGKPPNYTYTWTNGGARDGSGVRELSWEDCVSYAAWAGLRPMSELELEKAIRGFRIPAKDEVGPSYWGLCAFAPWEWDSFKSWEQQCERTVTVANAAGRKFKGTHGRGTLGLPADWPRADAVGSGFRVTYFSLNGGVDLVRSRISDRMNAAVADPGRGHNHKFRAVRTVPSAGHP